MKFFKDLLNKNSIEELEETQAQELEAKRIARKARKQEEKKQANQQPVKYKKVKKETTIRANKPEDFENKYANHTVKTNDEQAAVKVEWKKPKKAKVINRVPKETENFDELFGVKIKDIKIGDIATCEVLSVSRDGYIVNVDGTFIEAIMQLNEYDGKLEVGDKLEVVVYRLYDGEYYVSNRRLATIELIKEIDKKFESKQIVSATVVDFNERSNTFGVKIDGKIDGQVYAGNIDIKFVNAQNANTYIGKTYDFAIIKRLKSKKYKFELSRVQLMKEAQNQVLADLEVGEEISASQFTINRGGVEFDYQGVRGFIPLREISNQFIDGIDDIPKFLDLNAQVPVQIIEIKSNRGIKQLVCSIRSLQPSPWNNFIEKYADGSTLDAQIEEIRPYGFMVVMDCDVKTLLHKNNMSTEMGAEFKQYNVGDHFEVLIEEIDFDRKRVNITTSFEEEAAE